MSGSKRFNAKSPAVHRLTGIREDFYKTGFQIMVPSAEGEADLVYRGLSPYRFMLKECGRLTFVTAGKTTRLMAFGCEIAVSPHPSGTGALWSCGPVVRTMDGKFRAAPTPVEVANSTLQESSIEQYAKMYRDIVGLADSIRRDHSGLDWGDVEERSEWD